MRRRTLTLWVILFGLLSGSSLAEAPPSETLVGTEAIQAAPEPLAQWHDVIRQTPYWISQGVHDNLRTIRLWVLTSRGYCEQPERHILFDVRATFQGYLDNGEDTDATQRQLNELRAALAADGTLEAWVPGSRGVTGYPLALSCDQPDARLQAALDRYTGADSEALFWGTWDGMQVGSADKRVSLHEAVNIVYQTRREQGRIELPEEVLSTLAGKVIIESGGLSNAHSAANARGIMQLTPAALGDCEIAERFHFHRIAQIDCAMRLLEQNHRNLYPTFEDQFGHLPADKAEHLYNLLLLQAYHGGVGRVRALMTNDELRGAADYFAQHHERFSAGDIALGMVFHNLGRNFLGTASLYYLVDVSIASEAACSALSDLAGCDPDADT